MQSNPWIVEPELVSESNFQAKPERGEGYSSWNVMSPELEFCLWVGAIAETLETETPTVLETGMGQGYVTRRVLAALPPAHIYYAYEPMKVYQDLVPADVPILVIDGTPTGHMFKKADLVILDSDMRYRRQELENWVEYGKPGSHMVIHDTYHSLTPQGELTKFIRSLHLTGDYWDNPRGAFHSVHS